VKHPDVDQRGDGAEDGKKNDDLLSKSLSSFAHGIGASWPGRWLPDKTMNIRQPKKFQGKKGRTGTDHKNLKMIARSTLESKKIHIFTIRPWTQQNRTTVPGTALDGVFVLNKGFVKLDNSPITLNNQQNPAPGTHIVCNSQNGNLLMFFLAIQEACDNIQGAWLKTIPYLQTARFPNVQII
jgi:hypothetical protein